MANKDNEKNELRIPSYQIHLGNNLDILKSIPDESIDSIVTDPPYEIAFMGKGWDNTGAAYNHELWSECLRVLKAGGHLIAFGATRTIHRTTSAIEDAGFQIRDMIAWCTYQGFPKSLNISKAIDSTILKGGSHSTQLRETEQEFGLNPYSVKQPVNGIMNKPELTERKELEPQTEEAQRWAGWGTALKPAYEPAILARKPIEAGSIARQVLSTGTGAINIDECRFGYGDPAWIGPQGTNLNGGAYCSNSNKQKENATSFSLGTTGKEFADPLGRWPANIYQCPKPSRAERDEGLEHLEGDIKNIHPTVKPLKLMRWLCRLVTPEGGTVLDPFTGSGSTLAGAMLEGFDCIGCELTEDYIPIIEGRCRWAIEEYKRENAQLSFFDWLGERNNV